MKDYTHLDKYLNNLYGDIYEQPPDEGHKDFARASIDWMMSKICPDNVLDVGCGQGFCESYFREENIGWKGLTTGKDFQVCVSKDLNVINRLATFTGLGDNSVDTIYARHILEHSPFPILTLMEWKRISKNYLVLIYPAWEYWGKGGRNHYHVLDKERLWYNLTRAGWWPIHTRDIMTTDDLFDRNYPSREGNEEPYPGAPIPVEYWYICEQYKERID